MVTGAEIVTPNEASILSMFASDPQRWKSRTEDFQDFYRRLESPLSREIASVLVHPEDRPDASEEARHTAKALMDWYVAKREQARGRRDRQSRKRRLLMQFGRRARG